MSYAQAIRALDPGNVVTFNHSGNANANESPELVVAMNKGGAFQLFWGTNGTLYQLIDRDGELILQEDNDTQDETRPPDWKDYAVVETVELIGE